MKREDQADCATSIVRLSFQPAHKDKIEASKQWTDAMNRLRQEPDLGYVIKGESIDDEFDIVLLISWDYAAKPSANFLSRDIDYIFAPLDDLLTKKPRLIGNLCTISCRKSIHALRTCTGGSQSMIEIMTVRGPADATEAALRKISKDLSSYSSIRSDAIDFYYLNHGTFFWGMLFRLSAENDNEDTRSEKPTKQASFVLILQWSDREGRAEFQDPNIPDRTLPPVFQEAFPSNFWQEEVIKPLEELGATRSSWTYHKGETAHDGKHRMIVSKFWHWYHYGYMDSTSLAEFEKRKQNNQQLED